MTCRRNFGLTHMGKPHLHLVSTVPVRPTGNREQAAASPDQHHAAAARAADLRKRCRTIMWLCVLSWAICAALIIWAFKP